MKAPLLFLAAAVALCAAVLVWAIRDELALSAREEAARRACAIRACRVGRPATFQGVCICVEDPL